MSAKPQKLFFKHILRKIFLEDWALKLIAAVITLGLWFGVTGLSTPTTKRLTIPLNLNIASTAQVTNAPLQEVDIEISGDKRKVEQVNKAELSASIDLTDIAPGDRIIPLTPDTVYVPLPQGIKLTEVQPSRIAVKLEAVEEKDVEVRADTFGTPATGFEVYSTTVLPLKIRVRGPASIVSTLTYVQTERIDLTGRREDLIAKQVAVTSPNAQAAVLNTFVDVTFRIGEKRMSRTFSIPVAGMPETIATFTLYGPKSVITAAKKDAFYVEMNGDMPHVVLPTEWLDTVEVRDLTVKTTSSTAVKK
jgi:hypothetical protein